ncbi:MAG: hypothetical protein U0166_05815 [Acidobacteriota bacterium]
MARALKELGILAALGAIGASTQAAPLWYRTRGSSAGDQGWSVAVDAQGDIYLGTGGMTPASWPDWFIDKFSPTGQRVWQSTFGGPARDFPFQMAVDGGRLYVGGPYTPPGNGFNDTAMAVIALRTSDGGMDWPAPAVWDPGTGYEEVDGLVVDASGIYAAGWTYSPATQNDVGLWMIDPNGATVWTNTWGSPGYDDANGQIVLDGNRIIVGGRYDGQYLVGGDAFLAAFQKSDGSYVTHVLWGGAGTDDTLGIASDGASICAVGYTTSQGNGWQLFLLKYDLSFALQWSRLWGGAGIETARSLAFDGTDIVVAGQTDSGGTVPDVAILRYDAAGNLIGSKLWGGTSLDEPYAIAVAGGRAYVAGKLESDGAGGEDAFLLEVDPRAIAVPSFVAGRLLTGLGPGPTNTAEVRVWDQIAPTSPLTSWLAYGVAQAGVNVAGGNIELDAKHEVLTGPGPGVVFGPQVRAFANDGAPISHVNFYAYGTLRFGVHAAAGDVDGDGWDEVLTTPGPGGVFGPHVRGWDDDGSRVTAISKISYFAYGTLRFGARGAAGDSDADGFDEILTGPGAGAAFTPQLRGWNYDGSAISTTNVNLFAFATGTYGACVASGDTDGDGVAEVVAAHGPDPAATLAEVRGFDVTPASVTQEWALFPFLSLGGAEIAVGDIEADGIDELWAGEGWGAANPCYVNAQDIVGNTGVRISRLAFRAYPGLSAAYGVKVGIGAP